MKVIDWQFEDGSPPPQEVIDKWILLVKETFDPKGETHASSPITKRLEEKVFMNGSDSPKTVKKAAIAIHCVAGECPNCLLHVPRMLI